jgi:integrase
VTLSANSVNAYVRPIRSLAIWLVDEGLLAANPFRRSRRRAALNPLLPSEETPTKSATLEDLQALERGCIGEEPLDLRDAAIVSILVTTAARNSSVRLLRIGDVDFERSVIRFRRAKGGKTLELALQPGTESAIRSRGLGPGSRGRHRCPRGRSPQTSPLDQRLAPHVPAAGK